MTFAMDEKASPGKRKREDAVQDITLSSSSIQPKGAAYGDSYTMSDASFSQSAPDDSELFDDPMDVDEEDFLTPVLTPAATLERRQQSARTNMRRRHYAARSPLSSQFPEPVAYFRCPFEGCTFSATSPQHVEHHRQTFQHGRQWR